MTPSAINPCRVAIACGGTGGHLFPGMAVGRELLRRGCAVTLLVSEKEVDRQAARQAEGMQVVELPAVGLQQGNWVEFTRRFVSSYRSARVLFKRQPAAAALAMGGFTSAPPILAAGRGVRTYLHESNAVAGRANRWLSLVIDRAFVGFPEAAARLRTRKVDVTGTPVRPQYSVRSAGECRRELGLDPDRGVLLVMGGSQGAAAINRLVTEAIAQLRMAAPGLQWLHLAGSAAQAEEVRKAYASAGADAVVHVFLDRTDLALGAASVAVSRAGASSLAEYAAMQVPAVLIPLPSAADNHQFFNAQALVRTGAAVLLEQAAANPETLAKALAPILQDAAVASRMREALARHHTPASAGHIAEIILRELAQGSARTAQSRTKQTTAEGRGGVRECRTSGIQA